MSLSKDGNDGYGNVIENIMYHYCNNFAITPSRVGVKAMHINIPDINLS